MKGLFALLIFILIPCFCSVSGAKESNFFHSEKPVAVRIEAPLKTLKRQRGDDPEWLVGKVIVTGSNGVETVLDVQIKARGNYRRLKTTCPFPSYWLNFKKKQVVGTIFEGQDRLKVVAHCRETRKPFDPYIYKEYLAYKTYNLITNESFRVRLARIDYIDTESKYRREEEVAFFIEHTEEFEDRLDMKQKKDRYVIPSLYELSDLCRADLFQYLVGNTDYTFFASQDECCHNGKAFVPKDETRGFLPVPYDFDLSGLVDAPYGVVNKKLKIKTAKQRLYRGVEISREILTENLALYTSKKADIYALWENFEPLDDGHRVEALEFIDGFFETIENIEDYEEKLIGKMRSVEKLDTIIYKNIEKAGAN